MDAARPAGILIVDIDMSRARAKLEGSIGGQCCW